MVREVDSTSPPIPAVPFAKFGSDPPRYCQANPAGIPRRGFGYLANFRHGARLRIIAVSGRGSGLGSQAAELFAIGWPPP